MYEDLGRQLLDGTLSAPVEKVYPIEEIAAASTHAQRGERAGKILVAPNGPSETRRKVMSASFIVDLEVTDSVGIEERGGKHETLEGDWRPRRVVLLEFPSVEQAKRWYDSEEYRGPKALRFKTARTNLVLVEGVS